jgi:hypothetical protein
MVNPIDLRAILPEDVADAMLGPSTVDIDGVIRGERRRRHRRGLLAGLALVIAVGLVVSGLPLLKAELDRVNGAGPPPVAASATPQPRSRTEAQAQADAAAVVAQYFPDTVPDAYPHDFPPMGLARGDVAASAQKYVNGRVVAQVIAFAWFTDAPTLVVPGEPTAIAGNPCLGPSTALDGSPQFAAEPSDVCTSYPQPDGSVVWIRAVAVRSSGDRATYAIWDRPDGTEIHVNVYYPPPAPDAGYSESMLLHAITDPRLAPWTVSSTAPTPVVSGR